jgi:hypothetical protein
MQNASARLDVALPFIPSISVRLRSQAPSNLSSISCTKVSVLSSSGPVTMLSSTCVATKDNFAILVVHAPHSTLVCCLLEILALEPVRPCDVETPSRMRHVIQRLQDLIYHFLAPRQPGSRHAQLDCDCADSCHEGLCLETRTD